MWLIFSWPLICREAKPQLPWPHRHESANCQGWERWCVCRQGETLFFLPVVISGILPSNALLPLHIISLSSLNPEVSSLWKKEELQEGNLEEIHKPQLCPRQLLCRAWLLPGPLRPDCTRCLPLVSGSSPHSGGKANSSSSCWDDVVRLSEGATLWQANFVPFS